MLRGSGKHTGYRNSAILSGRVCSAILASHLSYIKDRVSHKTIKWNGVKGRRYEVKSEFTSQYCFLSTLQLHKTFSCKNQRKDEEFVLAAYAWALYRLLGFGHCFSKPGGLSQERISKYINVTKFECFKKILNERALVSICVVAAESLYLLLWNLCNVLSIFALLYASDMYYALGMVKTRWAFVLILHPARSRD